MLIENPKSKECATKKSKQIALKLKSNMTNVLRKNINGLFFFFIFDLRKFAPFRAYNH